MKIATADWRRRLPAERRILPIKKQGGLVLIMVLIVLVAMTLASIAMVRSIDTSALIAGNLAFKQSGISSGDAGVDAAISWLTANGASLTADSPVNGYYATSQDCLDLTGNGHIPNTCTSLSSFSWSDTSKVRTLSTDSAGNDVSYVIHRLCDEAGALRGDKCTVDEGVSQGGSSKGGTRPMLTYQPRSWDSVGNRGYYRITVRIAGPRKNVSFVQAIVSL